MLHAARQLPSWLTFNVSQEMHLPVLLFVICVLGLGCSRSVEHSATTSVALPQLFPRSEGGFADAELRAQEVRPTADEGITIVAAALYGKEEVAVRFTLLPEWRTSKPQELPIPLFGGKILIESVGPRTEAFARAVAKVYGQTLSSYESTFASLTAISLQGEPMQVRSQPIKLKIFYESSNEEEYAEAYLNFDLSRGIVQFHEKDPGYREALVRILTRKSG